METEFRISRRIGFIIKRLKAIKKESQEWKSVDENTAPGLSQQNTEKLLEQKKIVDQVCEEMHQLMHNVKDTEGIASGKEEYGQIMIGGASEARKCIEAALSSVSETKKRVDSALIHDGELTTALLLPREANRLSQLCSKTLASLPDEFAHSRRGASSVPGWREALECAERGKMRDQEIIARNNESGSNDAVSPQQAIADVYEQLEQGVSKLLVWGQRLPRLSSASCTSAGESETPHLGNLNNFGADLLGKVHLDKLCDYIERASKVAQNLHKDVRFPFILLALEVIPFETVECMIAGEFA